MEWGGTEFFPQRCDGSNPGVDCSRVADPGALGIVDFRIADWRRRNRRHTFVGGRSR